MTINAQARLGEKPEDVLTRYGTPLTQVDQKAETGKPALTMLTFQKNGYDIEVTIFGGVSAAESFKKHNGDSLTSDDIQTLLANNAQGAVWAAPTKSEQQKQWARNDGTMATLIGARVLYLTSKELLDEESQAQKLEHAPSLDGF
jgi:hypothetical protein